jgi:hypothetical protein
MTVQSAASGTRRTTLIGVAAVVAPTLVFSGYLVLSRNLVHSPRIDTLDLVGLAVSIAVGLSFIWWLPFERYVRVLLGLALAVVSLLWLPLYGLYFVCAFFRDCL